MIVWLAFIIEEEAGALKIAFFRCYKTYMLKWVPSAEEEGKCINAGIKKLDQFTKPNQLHRLYNVICATL